MKAKILQLKWLTVLLALTVAISSCEKEDVTVAESLTLKSSVIIPDDVCGAESFTIWAGQSIDVGMVTIQKNDENIFISIETSGDWKFQLSHVHIATTPEGIPSNKQGIPVPGKFMEQTPHTPPVSSFNYAFPNIYDIGQTIYIAVHLEAVKLDGMGEIVQEETAWAGNEPGNGPRWWFYMSYTIIECEDEGDDPGDICYAAETAWAGPSSIGSPWYAYITLDENFSATVPLWAGQHYEVGVVSVAPKTGDPTRLLISVQLTNGSILQEEVDNFYAQGYESAPESRPVSGAMEFKTIATGTYFEGEIPAANVNFVAVHVNVKRVTECN